MGTVPRQRLASGVSSLGALVDKSNKLSKVSEQDLDCIFRRMKSGLFLVKRRSISYSKGKYKPRVSNKEEYKKGLNYFERSGFLIEINKCSIKLVFLPKLY